MGYDTRRESTAELLSVRVQKKESGSCSFEITKKDENNNYKVVANSRNVNGQLASIAFKTRTNISDNKEIQTVDLTLLDREEDQILFVSFFQSLLTNELLNKMLGESAINEANLNFWLTDAQKKEGDDWVPVKNKNGKFVPRLNIREKGSDDPFFMNKLWDDSNSEKKCDHPTIQQYLEEVKIAKRMKSNVGMAQLLQDLLTEFLIQNGWEKESADYTGANYRIEGVVYKNPNIRSQHSANDEKHDNAVVDTGNVQENEEQGDDLPF